MTLQEFQSLIKSSGPKGTVRIALSNAGSEILIRGNWSIHAQMDLFRERVLFSSSWTEIWVSVEDMESVDIEGKRIVVRMKTNSIAWIPTA